MAQFLIAFNGGSGLGHVVSPPAHPVGPHSAPARPHIAAGFASSNIFWPGDTDANGTVYQCTYIPTLVLANHTRLIAHGSCGTEANSCNGLHLSASARLESGRGLPRGSPGNPIQEGKICQKHSDDGGVTWSKLRVIARGVDTGQIVWDDLRKELVMHYSTVPQSEACPDCPGGGAVMVYKSTDLGVHIVVDTFPVVASTTRLIPPTALVTSHVRNCR